MVQEVSSVTIITYDTPNPTIIDAHKRLLDANDAYITASQNAGAARQIETAALNDLNGAQRDFDEAVKRTRNAAAPGSDWKCTGAPAR